MNLTVGQLVEDALFYLMPVQEIADRPYMVGKVVDIPTIREKTDEAIKSLLAADVILSECNVEWLS